MLSLRMETTSAMPTARGASLKESLPKAPMGLPTCGVAYLFRQASPGRDNSLQCAAIRHRFLKPQDVLSLRGCPVLIDCCFLQRCFRPGLDEDSHVDVDVSSHVDEKSNFRNATKRYPIIAYSTDSKHSIGGKAVPEESKSWKLGVMMNLHPKLISICDVSYNEKGALIVKDSVFNFDLRSVPSVRYLVRIGIDTSAGDGLISCGTNGPNKLRSHQVPPSVLMRVNRSLKSVSPLVDLDGLSVGSSFRTKRTFGPNGPKTKRCRCTDSHTVVNAHRRPRLRGRCYLFPHVDSTGKKGADRLFARVPEDRIGEIFRLVLPPCSVSEYQEILSEFETITLRCMDVGEDGVSGIYDSEKANGEADDEFSDPEDRTGPTYMSWLPVRKKCGREPSPDELDGIVNVRSILDVLRSTHGRCSNAERKVANSVGLNVYQGTCFKARKPTARYGQSDIEKGANLYSEDIDPTLLPFLSYLMPKSAEHSIRAQCVADPVFHEFLVDLFSKSITGDDAKSPPKMGELLTRLQLMTGPCFREDGPRGFCNTNHGDEKTDSLVGQFSSVAMEAILDTLSDLTVDESKAAKSLWHVIRNGLPELLSTDTQIRDLSYAVKASCGYLCRFEGDCAEDVEVHAYFAFTEFGTAVRIDPNRILYNVFDTRFEHQTCVPVVREGDCVIVNDQRLSILAWGCGKSDRRLWFDNNVSPNFVGRMTFQTFIAQVWAHNAHNQAILAGHMSQQNLNAWLNLVNGGNQAN